MMLPPRKRIADIRRVLENERRAIEARFPPNGVPVTRVDSGRADYATFETATFRQRESHKKPGLRFDKEA